jgi:hypothetical protein
MAQNMRDIFESEIKYVEEAFKHFPWEDKNAYAIWLAQTYFYVCHSTRLLTLAASRFNIQRDALHRRFIAHTKEETAHEVLAIKDLEKLGWKITDIEETASIKAFYQTQYYQIEHVDPITFFGYILCLEGLAVKQGGFAAKKVVKAFGEKCASFLLLHSDEDPGHLEQAFKNLENTSSKEKEIIIENLKLSCALYFGMLKEVTEMATQIPNRNAA